MGENFINVKNIVEEIALSWQDEYLNLLDVEKLFGNNPEKIAESIISPSATGKL